MKKAMALLMALMLALSVAACGEWTSDVSAGASTATSVTAESRSTIGTGTAHEVGNVEQTVDATAGALRATYNSEDLDDSWDVSNATRIILSGDSINCDGPGAVIEASTITVMAGGTYILSGALTDGQVVVNSADQETVKLVFDGVDIACADSAPVCVMAADKVIVTLADGTQNSLSDGATYLAEGEAAGEVDAALFSKGDLTINGGGALVVTGSYRDGISSKDNLKITGGTITVDAVNDALKGRDCIGIKDGIVTLTAGGDGMQSNNDEDQQHGYVSLDGGVVEITAGTDGIQAETDLLIAGGTIDVQSGGGSANSSSKAGTAGSTWGTWGPGAASQGGQTAVSATTASAKGLKAGTALVIAGGTISLDCSDDAIHSNGRVDITGGTIALASGDDGVHADASLQIGGGELNVTTSYEGLESAQITVNDGTVHVRCSDDGINVAGGADGSAVDGRPGQNTSAVSSNSCLSINGGYIAVDAGGDGLDINGAILMTDGTVLINGPIDDGNGPLDYLGECTISGGFLVAVGSAGMAMAPSASSTQHSLLVNLPSVQAANTLVHVEAKDGSGVLTFAPAKQYQSVLLSSPDLQEGTTYTVYLGGSSSGSVIDSLYTGGAYSGGVESTAVALAGMVTTSGAAGRGGAAGGAGRPGRP